MKGDKAFKKAPETQDYATAKAARPFTSDTIVWLGKRAEFTNNPYSLFKILTPILLPLQSRTAKQAQVERLIYRICKLTGLVQPPDKIVVRYAHTQSILIR
jgi:hypothetical protein